MRCCPATPQTRRRCGRFSSISNDNTTRRAGSVWLMARGVPTEEVLPTGQARGLKAHEMRAADPPVHYLVGTPKGRLTRLEKHLVAKPWQEARPGVQVKLLSQ